VRTKADEWLHHLTGGANGLDASLLIGFQAGAAYGAAKRWPAERLGAAIRQLLVRHPHALAIGLGSDAERSELLAVQHQADPDGTFARRIFVGDSNLPLAEFAALIASLTLVLANDSGPMHLAVALGIPCVAVFGPTDWIATGYADGPRYRLIREPGVECSPCQRRECPIDHRCMTRIPVERAVLAAEELLAWARPATNAVENG
jgi:heptosyltransferase-2